MKTILLTGATGFLGSYLLKALIDAQYNVVIIKRSASSMNRLTDYIGKFKSYDIDKVELKKVFEENNINVVMHTACSYGRNGESITEVLKTNLMLGVELLELAIHFNTDTFFNTDTLLYKYINIYSLSKKQFVDWLQINSEKIQVVNLKLEHMYGPKDGKDKFTAWIFAEIKKDEDEIKLTSGKQKRDFIFIKDVVSAYMRCLEKVSSLKQFNNIDVGTGSLTTVREFVELVKKTYEEVQGSELKTKLNFGAIPYRDGEIMEPKIDNRMLLSLGWKPETDLKEGIQKIIQKGNCL